jgi:steroid 5-alpha reductase family enzyme
VTAISSIILASIVMSAMMMAAWAVQKATHQSGWADVFWSFAIGIGGLIVAILTVSDAPAERSWLVAAMVGFWSIRLGFYILARTATATYEDPRYADLRKQWGDKFQARLFGFLQIQALCGIGLVVSVYAAAHRPGPALAITDWIGLAILIVSVIGEGIADRQLRAFTRTKANHGKVCDRGLWGWSRHPNYFFEWLGWVAYPVIAISLDPYWWPGWLSLIGPVLMYWLLVHVSGIPPLEIHMLKSRGDAFKAYMARTSAFFPLPPRTQ